jgi:hypothetical protein
VRSHFKGHPLEHILLENYASNSADVPKKIEVRAFSNLTVWDLKKIVSNQIQVPARRIELKRSEE